MEYEVFQDDMLPEAARLLAKRHQRDRIAFPELPDRFEREAEALTAVETIWKSSNTGGIAAIRHGVLQGFLFAQLKTDALRGRHVWVDAAGAAIAETQSPELYRDLYGAAAEHWVQRGYFQHYVVLSASDAGVIEAWFRLGFGHEQAYAVKSLVDPIGGHDGRNSDVILRLATADDQMAVAGLSEVIRAYQARAPVFGIALPEDADVLREGYKEIVSDTTSTLWLAEQQARIVAFQGYFPTVPSEVGMLVPDNSIELKIAGTVPEYRGQGIQHALTVKGLHAARLGGYRSCITDWRVTNLSSSRFWPRQGFRPVAYRLSRRIDSRIAWAR